MQGLRHQTKGLVLMTATPMQVSPIEVWDLLNLLGLPAEWHSQAFLDFFKIVGSQNPSHAEFDRLAALFRAVEAAYGEVQLDDVSRVVPGLSKLKAKKILRALRDEASIPRRQLETAERHAALRILSANTPIHRLVSRHTRELLRAYYKAGKLSTRIADRHVEDKFVEMTPSERALYDAVEDYISTTYNNASSKQRNAVGFVMTIYRRRLASSFYALSRTLKARKEAVGTQGSLFAHNTDDDVSDDETADEVMDADEAAKLERDALALEEKTDIEGLLWRVKALSTDTKAEVLKGTLGELRKAGYSQVIIFTQYADTMDFLRVELARDTDFSLMCFSGRGGEFQTSDGNWKRLSREETKRLFREGRAEVLLCTDAAAEGLNFQFCGALVNYDMPWNPMRVEQRIGRIDRLGQQYERIKIINLHYSDTIETDVYVALRKRIGLFQTFVGRLQPILARLPRNLTDASLTATSDRQRVRANLVSDIDREVDQAQNDGFDLDEITAADLEEMKRPNPLYGMVDLDRVLRSAELLPGGVIAQPLGHREYAYNQPGMVETIRVTTDPAYFDEHPESTELWSPGSPLFPEPEIVAEREELELMGMDKKLQELVILLNLE